MATGPSEVLRGLAEEYARRLQETLGERLISVVLFGSVARGEAGPDSDVDLLLVIDGLPAGQLTRKAALADADARLAPVLDAAAATGLDVRLARLVRTRAEAARVIPLYLDMTEDAVLLYDRDRFFAGVLDSLRASLKRLGSRRIRTGATWYWDLKPDFKRGDSFEL